MPATADARNQTRRDGAPGVLGILPIKNGTNSDFQDCKGRPTFANRAKAGHRNCQNHLVFSDPPAINPSKPVPISNRLLVPGSGVETGTPPSAITCVPEIYE